MLTIRVNEDCSHLDYKPIFIEEHQRWWHPDDAIKHHEWIIKCIKEINQTQD